MALSNCVTTKLACSSHSNIECTLFFFYINYCKKKNGYRQINKKPSSFYYIFIV